MPLQRTNIGNAQMKRRSLDDRTLKRHKCRARALERERALEGESPSVVVLPATS